MSIGVWAYLDIYPDIRKKRKNPGAAASSNVDIPIRTNKEWKILGSNQSGYVFSTNFTQKKNISSWSKPPMNTISNPLPRIPAILSYPTNNNHHIHIPSTIRTQTPISNIREASRALQRTKPVFDTPYLIRTSFFQRRTVYCIHRPRIFHLFS